MSTNKQHIRMSSPRWGVLSGLTGLTLGVVLLSSVGGCGHNTANAAESIVSNKSTNQTIHKTVTITAYCACHKCCGSWSVFKKTASGMSPKQGRTVAMSRQIPFGSTVDVPSLGLRGLVVEDRLATKYDNRMDVYFDDHKEALKFGIKKGVAVVIKKGGVKS